MLTYAIRQGFGNLGAALVSFICVVAFKDSLIGISEPSKWDARCQMVADKMWRTIVAFGALATIMALSFRLTIPGAPRLTMDATMDIEKAEAVTDAYLADKRAGDLDATNEALTEVRQRATDPKATSGEFWQHLKQWRYGKILLGTAGSWFSIDMRSGASA